METFIVIENMVQISFRELKGRKEKIKKPNAKQISTL